MTMRICLIGDFSGRPDEGMKKVSMNLRKRLSERHAVLAVNTREVPRGGTVRRIRRFRPQVIHYIHGPTIRSLVLVKALALLCPGRPRTVVSATKPYFSGWSGRLVPFVRPDRVLIQSLLWESFFRDRGVPVAFFPNGVDCRQFRGAGAGEKRRLRRAYGLDEETFLVLHVGHIRTNRNLSVFREVQGLEGVDTLVVGGTENPADPGVTESLEAAGCRVWRRYFPDISELYRMADLYLFPTRFDHGRLPGSYNEIGAIDLPLSVLEAMASDLPVLSTPFGALPRVFREEGGLRFRRGRRALLEEVRRCRDQRAEGGGGTRVQALELSWERVIRRLEAFYGEAA